MDLNGRIVLPLAHLLGGQGCASRNSLLLCLPLITCHFYEKVRTVNSECESFPHLSRIGRSTKTNFPLTDSAFCARAAERTTPIYQRPLTSRRASK
jgi:hypothetical protein